MPMIREEPDAGWVVVIPVKPAAVGKSRLFAGLNETRPSSSGAGRADRGRTRLARAIALDTIAATAAACPVIVVTDDDGTAEAARALGAMVVGEGAAHGLDAAVAVGVTAAEASAPGAHRAALLGDLPALRPHDLADALREATAMPRAVVADAEGVGSTLITARAGVPWASAFGADSLRRHVALGCTVLDVAAGSTLRRDVDTPEQLREAARLGLGPHTAAALQTASGDGDTPPARHAVPATAVR